MAMPAKAAIKRRSRLKRWHACSLKRPFSIRWPVETVAYIACLAQSKPKDPEGGNYYRQRYKIENFFCRIKDWRRIATRYDKLARNFLAAATLIGALFWIKL
jgi:hypothetical protein